MKQRKLMGKKLVTLCCMFAVLAAAVWLNVKYSSANGDLTASGEADKYLGEAIFVNGNNSSVSVSGDASDYFATAKAEREKTREDAIELLEETISDAKLSENEKAAAVATLAGISDAKAAEAAIETLLKAKGFEKVIVVIGDDTVSVVVKCDHELLDSEAMQITDAVTSQTKVKIENIKIIPLK